MVSTLSAFNGLGQGSDINFDLLIKERDEFQREALAVRVGILRVAYMEPLSNHVTNKLSFLKNVVYRPNYSQFLSSTSTAQQMKLHWSSAYK